ncbi:restriction endonuclease subunit S [Clostridium tyrobutyricum]|jgi:type I restriction enzyme S subunit|uniref:restriction endonuclease subunit S n=1 Tax=Clostridium tyrobutyricum TaxID=1519 RepID=UPI00241F6A8B|nr:restriction endonuclease subunit S [Clostridium tyrobutyricum]
MVNSAAIHLQKAEVEVVEVTKEELNWSTVSLSDVINKGKRLEASVFDVESKHARELVRNSKYGYAEINLSDDIIECYTRPRFKRIWLEKSEYPIYQPTSMLDVYPTNDGYISRLTNTDIDALRVHKGQVLVTCSGTIGNVSFVSDTLDKKIFSHDLLRIRFKKEADNGFFYTFLRTDIGKSILKSNKYGSVISHIEAEHINEVIMPTPPIFLKQKIHDLIVKSYENRDYSNHLIDEATKLLVDELELPSIEEMQEEAFSYSKEINYFRIKLSELNGRLEGSYHVPIVDVIEKYLSKNAILVRLDDESLTKKIILAGVFKRNYVQKGHGYPFIGGKEITQLGPETDKYLSKITHKDRYEKELRVEKNWILVTDRGTIGKVVLVPEQMNGFAVSQNVLKVVPNSNHGYIYCFLNSDYGKKLIEREIYGSVVNMIDDKSLGNIKIPILKDEDKVSIINDLVIKANDLRYEAYKKEQKAIDIMNKEVLGI